MGFLIFATNFMFIALLSWIFELLLGFEKYSVRTWVWFILLNEFDWVLVILIVICLSHCFSYWCLCSKLCFITILLCAYHVHGRVSQWQLFVTVWCSVITLYWLIGIDLVHVPWLSEISLWISFFYLNLIKLMFVSCGVALGSWSSLEERPILDDHIILNIEASLGLAIPIPSHPHYN